MNCPRGCNAEKIIESPREIYCGECFYHFSKKERTIILAEQRAGQEQLRLSANVIDDIFLTRKQQLKLRYFFARIGLVEKVILKTKICVKCKRELPLNMFWQHPQTRDHKYTKCIDCVKQERKAILYNPSARLV